MNNKRAAVFAGSFDPFTVGHYEILSRAASRFDEIILAVAKDTDSKKCFFDLKDRLRIAELSAADIPNVRVMSFDGLLTDFMKKEGVDTLIRGLRSPTDVEHENRLSNVYRILNKEIEIFYLISSHKYTYVSSTIVRELLSVGGDITEFVAKSAADEIARIYRQR